METLFGQSVPEDNPIDDQPATELAFFLGAGASIRADVPDTFAFVEAFVQSLDSDHRNIVVPIIRILNKWASEQNPTRKVDIELLLEALQRLVDKDNDLLLSFFENNIFKFKDFDAGKILRILRDFIKSKVIVDAPAVKYLEPLRAFIQESRPFDIYSANYDTCIEQLCSENKLDYRDGFDEAWNPKVFDDTDVDIRLFKIHGSVTWYRSNRGRFLKIPVMTKDSSIELFTKERAENVMLYPAQKFEYVEPLFGILIQMKQRLSRCKTLFVVGYSFRDDHIRRILWDVARKNRDFQIVLIDPFALKIYQERLRVYEDGKTPSSLVDKVICLPYLFEKILPALRSEFYSQIQSTRITVRRLRSAEISGSSVNWIGCLQSVARAGDNEELMKIFEKLPHIDGQHFGDVFRSLVLGLIHSIGNQDSQKTILFWERLKKETLAIFDQLTVQVHPASSQISAGLKFGSPLPFALNVLKSAIDLIEARKGWMVQYGSLDVLFNTLKDLLEILKIWSNGYANFDDYQTVRHPCPPELKNNLMAVRSKSNCTYGGVDLGPLISQQVIDIEKSKVGEVFEKNDKTFLDIANVRE